MMKRRCLFEKTVRFLITGSVIAAVAVGFYLIGYHHSFSKEEFIVLRKKEYLGVLKKGLTRIKPLKLQVV